VVQGVVFAVDLRLRLGVNLQEELAELRGRDLAQEVVLKCACIESHCDQGDQMCFRKNRPKRSPTHFLSKLIQNLYRGPIILATFVIFKSCIQPQ
jgi:hypothetical protein